MRFSFLIIALIFCFYISKSEENKTKNRDINFNYNKKLLIYGIPVLIVSFSLDNSVKNNLQENKSEFWNKTLDFFDGFGSIYGVATPIVGYTIGYINKSEKLKESSKLAMISGLISVSIVYPLKIITHRKRPDNSDYLSFPSGHTAFAFAIFGSYAKYYKNYKYLLYAIPTLTAISRIYKNRHYFSDTVGGAIIGLSSIYIGDYILRKYMSRFSFHTNINKNSYIFNLKYNF